jgi:hypothetical protein
MDLTCDHLSLPPIAVMYLPIISSAVCAFNCADKNTKDKMSDTLNKIFFIRIDFNYKYKKWATSPGTKRINGEGVI